MSENRPSGVLFFSQCFDSNSAPYRRPTLALMKSTVESDRVTRSYPRSCRVLPIAVSNCANWGGAGDRQRPTGLKPASAEEVAKEVFGVATDPTGLLNI